MTAQQIAATNVHDIKMFEYTFADRALATAGRTHDDTFEQLFVRRIGGQWSRMCR
jgi:hypothetical protein